MGAGQLSAISFKREVTWGTPVVPDKSIPVQFDGGIQTDNDMQLLSAVQNKMAKNYEAMIGKRVHEGNYAFDLFVDYPYFFLLSAMGAVNSVLAGGETIVYNHTFTEAETKPSLTIEQAIGENIRRYAGALATMFKFSGEPGQPSMAEVDIKAKTQALASAITPAFAAPIRPFNFVDTVIKVGGVTMTEIQAHEFEYNNNVEFKHTIGSNDAQYRYIKGSEIKGKFEMYLDSVTLQNMTDFLNKTEREIKIEITGGAIGVGSNYKIVLTVPRAVFTVAETKISEDYNQLAVEFEGLYDSVTSKLLDVVVTNLLPNYN